MDNSAIRSNERAVGDPSLVIHYHIFKNAGTSVDSALSRCFGDAWKPFEGAHAHDVRTVADIRQFLQENPGLKALSTHLGRPPVPHKNAHPIAFLRHPILRARSVFEFLRLNPSHPGPKSSLSDFVRWALRSDDGGVVIRDYQVMHLSSASFTSPSILVARANGDHLQEASALLQQWGTVGIVEEYDRSLAVFQKLYESKVPSLDLKPFWLNRTTTERMQPLEDMIGEVQQAIGSNLYDELVGVNQLDLALYAFGRELFNASEAKALCPPSAVLQVAVPSGACGRPSNGAA